LGCVVLPVTELRELFVHLRGRRVSLGGTTVLGCGDAAVGTGTGSPSELPLFCGHLPLLIAA
jgi:hypothetical protein